jgi:hypothetical protein
MKTINGVKTGKQSKALASPTLKPAKVGSLPQTPDKTPRESEDLARCTANASEHTLSKIWDSAEEDEAWRHL